MYAYQPLKYANIRQKFALTVFPLYLAAHLSSSDESSWGICRLKLSDADPRGIAGKPRLRSDRRLRDGIGSVTDSLLSKTSTPTAR